VRSHSAAKGVRLDFPAGKSAKRPTKAKVESAPLSLDTNTFNSERAASMKCPHCLTDFHDHPKLVGIGHDVNQFWGIVERTCSACSRYVLDIVNSEQMWFDGSKWQMQKEKSRRLIYPKAANRTPPSPDVPKEFADDYVEACLVLADSPKASAALSRRCLQHILREVSKVKHADLFNEIQEVIGRGSLPTHISESLDAVRNIGNFAAHPMKAKSTGEIVPVEPGEAEWNLDTLEALFDFYFVQPALMQKKKDALNKKLQSAGKPIVK